MVSWCGKKKPLLGGSTFSLANRFSRLIWMLVWCILARWTPVPIHKWRIFLLNLQCSCLS